ncbi:hypothetical protein AWENTII_005939 [Aspergillus wentii]|nr:hypothetical protein MW887_000175 [Aspergillus wentii]
MTNGSWSADLPNRELLTENDMQQIASNTENGLAMLTTALDRKEAGFTVTEKVIQAAASNEKYAVEILDLLRKNGGADVAITPAIVCAAAGNSLAAVEYLFQLPGRSLPTLEDSLLAAVGHEDEAAAKMCANIIKQFPDARVSSRVLEATGTKAEVMKVLLDLPCDPLPIQDILRQVARNRYGDAEAQVVQVLLDRKLLVVDEWVMETLAANGSAFEIVVSSQPDAPITRNVLLKAASIEESMDALVENRPDDVVITEDVMLIAARSMYTTASVIEKTEPAAITTKVVKEAAYNEQPDGINGLLGVNPDLDLLAIWDEIWQDVDVSPEAKYRATRAIFLNSDLEITPSKLRNYPYDAENKNNYGLDEVVLEVMDDDRILPINQETMEVILERCDNKTIRETLEVDEDMGITPRLIEAAKRNQIADKEELLSLLEKRG